MADWFAARRSGVTLIELLVVMTILLIITSVGLRTMQADMKSRRQREAARAISVYLGAARSRAMEIGRPCGVRFEAGTITQVETPTAFAGATTDARCTLTSTGGSLKVTGIDASMATAGSMVQFNGQGPYYSLSGTGGTVTATPASAPGQAFPWGAQPISVSFRVQRAPVKSAAMPLQLPRGTAIDLTVSGDDFGVSFGSATAVTVTFAPNGAIDQLWVGDAPVTVLNPLYFLVGKIGGTDNWKMFENYWIALRPSTGMVTVTEVAAQDTISNSRSFARNGLVKGGR